MEFNGCGQTAIVREVMGNQSPHSLLCCHITVAGDLGPHQHTAQQNLHEKKCVAGRHSCVRSLDCQDVMPYLVWSPLLTLQNSTTEGSFEASGGFLKSPGHKSGSIKQSPDHKLPTLKSPEHTSTPIKSVGERNDRSPSIDVSKADPVKHSK